MYSVRKTDQKTVRPFDYYALLFFAAAFAGWLWEVLLYLVTAHTFVNRGVYRGPYLPIYGAGCVLLILLLRRLRRHPAAVFVLSCIFCTALEYFSGVWLLWKWGVRWWDYSGYFLNLNGRICAEGLLVFGIGGMVFVYVAAPLLDNWIRGIKKQALVYGCLALIGLFLADCVYSSRHPNEGKGITDYQPLAQMWDCRQSRYVS